MSTTTVTTTGPVETQEFTGLDNDARRVFIGLMLGMLVASISQTIVSPAMPRIVAELGGMAHYSWIATAAMLVSAIAVPIVGKLSDLYGRRPFYLGGLIVFMIGSILAGAAQNFWFLVFARAIQGAGMGTIMPLSQTIIGDIIPPRQRGKYQGLMGGIFGLSSIAGPLAGGLVTDHLGWRWLFYISLPVGIVAFAFIFRFLRLPFQRRDAKVDVLGIITLTVALVSILLATSLGGVSYPWSSWQIITMYAVGAVFLVAFVLVQQRASEPVIPPRLFANPIFTFSNVASFCVAMMMFGAMIYIPVYAQGVLGVSATNSGLILMPMSVAMIGMSILSGLFITRTGRYKSQTVVGLLVMAAGLLLLVRLDYGDSQWWLTLAMVVFGLGLGLCLQVYVLVVQNSVQRRDLGVATAATQFFRNVGSTVGIAVFGTILSTQMPKKIVAYLPPQAASQMGTAQVDAGSVLDPAALAKLPPVIADAIRHGLADSLHDVFLAALPLAGVALVATLLIRAIPLRDTVHSAEQAGRAELDAMAQTSGRDVVVPLGRETGSRTSERLLGMRYDMLVDQVEHQDRPMLRRAITEIGDGDFDRGLALLGQTGLMLSTEDNEVVAETEPIAVAVARKVTRHGVLSADLRTELAAAAAEFAEAKPTPELEATVAQQHEAVDVAKLHTVGEELTAALLVDLHRQREAAAVPRHAVDRVEPRA